MKQLGIIALALIVVTGITGCDYERINILVGSDYYVGKVISKHYGDVEVRQTGILLKPGARLAIRSDKFTQFIAQYQTQVISGEGMNVYLRAVEYNFDTTRGIRFSYTMNGCSIRLQNGKIIPLKYNADFDIHNLTFTNEAGLVGVDVDCNKLYEGPTKLPATEYVIFEALPGSQVELRSLNYFNSNGE